MRLELTPLQSMKWEVITDFIINTSQGTFIVPKGFISDLASSPQFMWWLIPPTGEYIEASILHDYLYKTHLISKIESDLVFKEIMLQYNTKPWKANLLYKSVKWFGGSSYNWDK